MEALQEKSIPKIVGKIRAIPYGDEKHKNGEWIKWVLYVQSDDDGEEKATALIDSHGPMCKRDAELFANMLNSWAGK